MLVQFTAWKETKETVWIEPSEVCSVREFQDRQAYGGLNDVSEICLKNGGKFKVFGHIASTLDVEMRAIEHSL